MSTATAERKIYTRAGDFREFVAVMLGGEVIEIDAAMFRYWLNVLPTKGERTTVEVGGAARRVDFLQGEGREELTAFWIEQGEGGPRYYCQRTDIMNPYA